MGFISILSRFSSSSSPPSNRFLFSTLRASSSCFNSLPSQLPKPDPVPPPRTRTRILSLLSLAAAGAVGGYLLSATCDPAVHHRIGGKDSTEILVQGTHKEVPREFIDELRAICGENMTLDIEERYFHGKPQNSFHKAVNVPDAVVYPRSGDDVHKIVLSCNKYKIPIVPYGGATSIEGHTLAPNGGVCIDMTLMNKIKSLHVEDMDVVVEPGIGWIELNEYLKPYGLFFPLDPG
ncbi:uncharacterized protein A4U43_C01F33900 [Asparagus officinalis]|uniref:FAD-binding PCMH-type domain-containing protein n=2 Tax=Asparagus officinalis TaxID=4686 RepID=A0A5P1FWW5_ASPOF|nr:uncharacterized protein A4U43_C01F33900 [Asparagus officinalis]